MNFFSKLKSVSFALLLLLTVASTTFASGPTLPDIGVDATDYVGLVGTSLGTIFGSVVALGLAFWLARKGIGMLRGGVR